MGWQKWLHLFFFFLLKMKWTSRLNLWLHFSNGYKTLSESWWLMYIFYTKAWLFYSVTISCFSDKEHNILGRIDQKDLLSITSSLVNKKYQLLLSIVHLLVPTLSMKRLIFKRVMKDFKAMNVWNGEQIPLRGIHSNPF